MKYITISLALLTLMIWLCITSSHGVIRVVDDTSELLESAVSAEKSGNKDDSLRMIQEASQVWKISESFFGTVLRHDEIDNVIEEFARLESYASTEDQDDFLSNCSALIARLEHIKSMEKPSFQNIM